MTAIAQITDIRSIVRDYVPGQKITEPGIYRNVPMDAYHGDLCDGPSVSKSVLYKCEEQTAKHAFADWYGNPKRKVKKTEANHYSLGRAVHHLAGGEAQFAKHFAVRPAIWEDWRKKEAQEWKKTQLGLGMGVLTGDDVDTISGIADSLAEHPTIQAGIMKGLVEHTVVWKDAATGLWIKTRPDVIAVDSRMISDLKTCASAAPHRVQKAIGEFGYHMQLAMMDIGLRVVTNSPMNRAWAEEHLLVFVEKSDPFVTNIKPVADWALDYGQRQFRRALDLFASCLASGVWTGYPDDEVATGFESWRAKRLAWESDNGLLPKSQGGVTSAKGYTPPEAQEPPRDAGDEDEGPEETV